MGKPAPNRRFPASNHPVHGFGHAIKCQCGAEQFVTAGTASHGGFPTEVVAKRLQRAGWSVTRGGRDVLCNACAYGRKPKPAPASAPAKTMAEALAQAAQNLEPKKEPAALTTTATPASQAANGSTSAVLAGVTVTTATREQKREIMDFLNSHYDGSAWAGSWSDAKAAEKLGVPRVWVQQIRVEFFGDADTNAAAAEARREAAEIRAQMAKLGRSINDAVSQLAGFEAALSGLAARLSIHEKGL